MWHKVRSILTHPKIIVLEAALVGLWLLIGSADQSSSVTLVWTDKSYQVSEDFFGVAIDAAMLTQGTWWESSDAPPRPLDLNDEQLNMWASLLAPDWVRLGGTEADKLWLVEPSEKMAAAPVLARYLFVDFIAFARSIGAKPFITSSAGPRVRTDSHWQSDQLIRLLSWLPDDFDGALEFGNEPGSHWLMFGRHHQISFEQLADEYRQARKMTQAKGIELAGPANAFWPGIGEPLNQVFGSSKDFLKSGANPDIFTWHYYPTQSNRCVVKTENADWEGLLDDETLQEFEQYSLKINTWLQRWSPNSQQWLGETGPAQCGGKAKLTDRFGASLWWLAHIGVAAQTGNQTIIRQSLVGGDYALLRYRQGYSPNPDYWASLLWQQNMGSRGFKVSNAQGYIRAIAHCHANRPKVMSMVLINLLDHTVMINLPQAQEAEFIDITSHSLESRYTFVEDRLAESLMWQEDNPLPWQPISAWRPMSAYSYRWVNIMNADQCGDSS